MADVSAVSIDADVDENGFGLYTTDQLLRAMADGYEVELVALDDAFAADAGERVLSPEHSQVAAIDFIGCDEVQCIRIDDDDHLYVTDDYIPTHNTANIVFLKSTDDEMIETLSKMSGKTHVTYRDQKTVTTDVSKRFLKNEGTVSYVVSTTEAPVISYNDLAFLPERNSIMFIASNPCVWNRNETILPMSWRLYGTNTIRHPGHKYTLQTVPTLSSAIDFDVRQNQPDFGAMLDKRIEVAWRVEEAKREYNHAFKLSELDLARLAQDDTYASNIMDLIDRMIYKDRGVASKQEADRALAADAFEHRASAVANTEVAAAVADQSARARDNEKLRYAQERMSRANFVGDTGCVNRAYEQLIVAVYNDIRNDMVKDETWFRAAPQGGLMLHCAVGDMCAGTVLIRSAKDPKAAAAINAAARERGARVSAIGDAGADDIRASSPVMGSYVVCDEFFRLLASFDDDWPFANGLFSRKMRERFDTY